MKARTTNQRKAWLRIVYVGKTLGVEGGRRVLCKAEVISIKPDYPMAYTVRTFPTDLDPTTENLTFGPQGLLSHGVDTLYMVPYTLDFHRRMARLERKDYRNLVSQTVLQGNHYASTLKKILGLLKSTKQAPFPKPKTLIKKGRDWPRNT